MALTAKKVYAILKRQISDMEAKLNSPVRYRGTVATADLLPLNPDIGDMYNIESKSVYGEAGMNVAWNGVVWDTMGAPIDMSLYIKSSELADWVKQQNKPTYTANEVGALPADTKIPSKTSELKNDSGFLTKVPDGYLNGTDTTLKESGKAADAKATGDKFTEMSADISKKLNKNQGSENSGKIAGINETGDIVPMFPMGVEYNSETNCLEFGSDQKMKLNQGIGLDSSLTKTGYAADAGVVGEVTNSLKEDLDNKITKFYASNQGETHLADSDNGKIMDMMVYGRSEQKQYSGKNLLNMQKATVSGWNISINIPLEKSKTYTFTNGAKANNSVALFGINSNEKDELLTEKYLSPNKSSTFTCLKNYETILLGGSDATTNIDGQYMLELGSEATSYEPYVGGQPSPSPSPDYPQEIKSVVNPTVKVCGKNLINIPDGETTVQKYYNVDVPRDVPITLSSKIARSDGGVCRVRIDYKLNGEIVYGMGTNVTSGLSCVTATVPRKAENTRIVFQFLSNNSGTLTYEDAQIELGSTPTAYEPYHEQTVTLPYTLNAIPVSSGGNITINGQQYIADYVDVERGKLVRMISPVVATDSEYGAGNNNSHQVIINKYIKNTTNDKIGAILCDKLCPASADDVCNGVADNIISVHKNESNRLTFRCTSKANDMDSALKFIKSCKIYAVLDTPEEIDLTPEEIAAFKALATYYPTTNISVNSEQLDGYTVFNYPISMANGWNYVKQQIGDTREYIYDMDARIQDTDLQAAEAYVNSEYAVVLTELEV